MKIKKINRRTIKMKEKEEAKLKTIRKIDIPEKYKKIIKKEMKRWIPFIKEHRGKLSEDNESHYQYHTGEISFIEFFCNVPLKKRKKTTPYKKAKSAIKRLREIYQ